MSRTNIAKVSYESSLKTIKSKPGKHGSTKYITYDTKET